jgi:hypothetical protein
MLLPTFLTPGKDEAEAWNRSRGAAWRAAVGHVENRRVAGV